MKVDHTDEDGNSGDEIVNDKVEVDDKQELIDSTSSTRPSGCWNRFKGPARYRWVTIEPVMVLFMVAFDTISNTRGQYVRQTIAAQFGVVPHPGASTCVHRNSTGNTTSNATHINHLIQAEMARYGLYLSLAEAIPHLISVPILGSWSDIIGRKKVMLIPLVGYVVGYLSTILIMALELPLNLFFLVNIIQGGTGGMGLIIACCFSYISDVTPKEKLTSRIVILELLLLLSIGITQMGLGYFIYYEGFLPPSLMALTFTVLALLYVLIPPFLPESYQKGAESSDAPTKKKRGEVIRNIIAMFKNNTDRRRLKLAIYFPAQFFIGIAISSGGLIQMEIIRGVGEPFCWNVITINYFVAWDLGFTAIGALIAGKLLGRCLGDIYILYLALADIFISLAITATAPSTPFIFLAAAVGMLKGIVSPVLKTLVAKIVTDKEQGTLFAFMGGLAALTTLLHPVILNPVYAATVTFYPQFVFFYIMSLMIIPATLCVLLHIVMRAPASKKPDSDLTTPVPEEGNQSLNVN